VKGLVMKGFPVATESKKQKDNERHIVEACSSVESTTTWQHMCSLWTMT